MIYLAAQISNGALTGVAAIFPYIVYLCIELLGLLVALIPLLFGLCYILVTLVSQLLERMKIQIIVLFQNLGEESPYYAQSPAPPLPGILLAGMTPPIVDVEVLHEMVRPIRYHTDADVIALSFMDYLAPHAFYVARRFKALGKTVIGGGKYISAFPEEAQAHFDSILVGEAQGVWPAMVRDLVAGDLKRRYDAPATPSLADIPPPRYDLVESRFTVPIVTETSRPRPASSP